MGKRSIGQVLVEVALAVVGLVVLGFVCVRVGQWVNHSMVERNADFQRTRGLAGTPGAGVVKFYLNPTRIHLLGPDADSSGAPSSIPEGLSTAPPSCPAGASLIAQINDLRTLILEDWRARDELLKTNRERTCLAVDLDMAAGDPPAGRACEGGAAVCAGNVFKSANWFWRKATRLDQILRDIATWEANRATAVSDKAAAEADKARAEAIVCPACTTTRVCGAPGRDCTDNTACKSFLRASCNGSHPPGPARDLCYFAADGWCDTNRPCVDTPAACSDVPDCTAHDTCETNKTNAINAAQTRIDNAQARIERADCMLYGIGCGGGGLYGEKDDLCAAVGTGNPEVGGAPTCDVDSIKAYAGDVDARAQAVNTEAQSVVDELHDLSGRIQSRMLLLEELERQAHAACSSEAP